MSISSARASARASPSSARLQEFIMRIASILQPRTLAIGALAALAFTAFSADASAQKLTFTSTIDQAQETPPTGSAATGTATFVVDRASKTLNFFINFSG